MTYLSNKAVIPARSAAAMNTKRILSRIASAEICEVTPQYTARKRNIPKMPICLYGIPCMASLVSPLISVDIKISTAKAENRSIVLFTLRRLRRTQGRIKQAPHTPAITLTAKNRAGKTVYCFSAIPTGRRSSIVMAAIGTHTSSPGTEGSNPSPAVKAEVPGLLFFLFAVFFRSPLAINLCPITSQRP